MGFYFIRTVAIPEIPIITDGLILHLDAQDLLSYPGSGTDWFDLTENANTASLSNISLITGTIGEKYFNFNGSNSVAIIPEKSNFNTQTFTIEVWIKTTSLSQNGFLFEKGNVNTQYAFFFEGTNLKLRGGGDTNIDAPSNVTSDEFTQVTAVYSNGNKKIYVNGSLIVSTTGAGALSTNPNGISIGAYGGYNGGRGYYYTGSVSIVRFYDRELTLQEITQNYNVSSQRYFGTIIGYITGSSNFVTPDIDESFEYSSGWQDSFDASSLVSGSSTFTTTAIDESFEYSSGWQDSFDASSLVSGSSTFTTADIDESFESGSGWG